MPRIFYSQATESLRTKASRQDLKKIEKAVERKDMVMASEVVHQVALKNSIRSKVAISSSKGPNAMVRYQTLGQRSRNEAPTTAKTLTDLTEEMYLGRYFIWAERNGAATSDKDSQFDVLEASGKVHLLEK
jgi:hypothetical protein